MNIIVKVNGLSFELCGDPFIGRQSAVKEYLNCHRLYGWERIENLAPDRPEFPLEFGSATHMFLQERRRGLPVADAMRIGLERLVRDFPAALLPTDFEELEKHKELGRSLWPAYEAYWKDEEDFLPLGQEVAGEVEVGSGSGVKLVFRLDRIVSWIGQFWIWDYKTMGKNDDRTFQQFEMDIQPTAYIYGASKVLKHRVAGLVIDGLIKTKQPQFRREQYLRTDAELLEFESEFVEICHEMAWRHARVANGENWKTVFYKNPKHCFGWYRPCKFYALCTNDTPMNRMAYKQREQDYMDDPKLLHEGNQ
jgi:DNA-binding HxlR family transcriptional regulator